MNKLGTYLQIIQEITPEEVTWEIQKWKWLIALIQSRKGENKFARKACKSKSKMTVSGSICRVQAKIKFNQGLINKVMSVRSECNQSKNPEKCKAKANKQILKLRKIIKGHQYDLRNLEKQKGKYTKRT